MTLRALLPAALAVCLAAPAFAQQHAVSAQEARQVADHLAKQFETAYNAGNAAGIAALFAQESVYLTPVGTSVTDRQAIERGVAARIHAGWTQEAIKITEAHPAGDVVWATGEYSIDGTGQNSGKQIGGRFAEVLTREGGEWRIRMLIGNLRPPQDVTGQAAATQPGGAPPSR